MKSDCLERACDPPQPVALQKTHTALWEVYHAAGPWSADSQSLEGQHQGETKSAQLSSAWLSASDHVLDPVMVHGLGN